MKINIIHHTQTNNIVLDAETLSYLFKRFKSKPKIEHVNISNYTSDTWNCENILYAS